MRTSRYTDNQIMAILKQNEDGARVPDLCREHGMSAAMFYKWRSKFGGMDTSLMKRMKELEEESRRLRKMYAEEKLEAETRPCEMGGLREDTSRSVGEHTGDARRDGRRDDRPARWMAAPCRTGPRFR